MNLTENIPTKNISKNSFELHCQWASEKNLCWNLHCTTCGSHEFRSGIYAIMTGENFKHGEQWNTHCKSYTGPWFKWDVTLREYITFCQVIIEASLFRISQTSKFPDWLGYLGICLSWLEKWEREEKHLTQIWGSQLMELCQEKESFPEDLISKIENQTGYLHYSDLGYFESEISQTSF